MQRKGFTLLEVLVATTISLALMGATMLLLQSVTSSMGAANVALDISTNLQSAAMLLESDLAGVTVNTKDLPAKTGGYFVLEEKNEKATPVPDPKSDIVDQNGRSLIKNNNVLRFTTRSLKPHAFQDADGKSGQIAEVVWMMRENRLYRMVKVVETVKDLDALADRAKRFNPGMPAGVANPDFDYWITPIVEDGGDENASLSDEILSGVLSFDVKVWDKAARKYVNLGEGSDFANPAPIGDASFSENETYFFDSGRLASGSIGVGCDGLDNDGDGRIDDINEQGAWSAPCDVPLNGLQVTIRVGDPDLGEVQTKTVTGSF